MTCILGLRTADASYLASDGQCTVGDEVVCRATPKIFRWGRFLVGASGYARLATLIESYDGDRSKAKTVYELVNELRGLVLADGWKHKDNHGPPDFGTSLLVAASEMAWLVCAGWGVLDLAEGRPTGIGHGQDYGAGAAWAALKGGSPPAEALCLGIKAACEYDVYCGGEAEVWRIDETGRATCAVQTFSRVAA